MARREERSRCLLELAKSLGYEEGRSAKRGKAVILRHATTGALVILPRQLATVGRDYANHEALIRRGARRV